MARYLCCPSDPPHIVSMPPVVVSPPEATIGVPIVHAILYNLGMPSDFAIFSFIAYAWRGTKIKQKIIMLVLRK